MFLFMSFLHQNAIYLAEDKEIKEGSQELLSFTLPSSDLSVQAHNECFTALLLMAFLTLLEPLPAVKNRTDKCTYRNRSRIVPLCKPTRQGMSPTVWLEGSENNDMVTKRFVAGYF